MSSEGYDEKRKERQIKSARLKSIKSRSRPQSPESSETDLVGALPTTTGKRSDDKQKLVKLNVAKPQVVPGKSIAHNSKMENFRRMTQTYMGPLLPGKEEISSTQKYLLQRKVMEKERRKAAAYRKSIGRRNAFDFGPSKNRRPSVTPRSKSVQDDREKTVLGADERCKSSLEAPLKVSASVDIGEVAEGTGLTGMQVRAFYEVFELFDSNGGGSIDADELDEALRSVGITLTREEIFSVLNNIDKDGNGEIDFKEFLQLMTNTERFIESLTTDEESSGRETLLFEALTEFMKKAALHSMDEIVGYYSHKYKKTQIPHVVNHYAAGARLIGLTERQLKQHFRDIKASNRATGARALKSPYAEPLHILHSTTNLQALGKLDKSRKRGRITLFIKVQKLEERGSSEFDTYKAAGSCRGGKMTGDDGLDSSIIQKKPSCHIQSQVRLAQELYGRLDHIPVHARGYGWVNERTEHIDVQLPPLHLRKLMPFSDLTAEDLPSIRTNVLAATQSYIKQRRQMVLQDNFKHWKALEVGLISPEILQSNFKGIYNVYSLVPQRHLKIPPI